MGRKDNKSFRNVLALPTESFWPLIQDSESEISLRSELQKVLKLARTIRPQINWKTARKLIKEEKAKKINEFFENLPAEELESHKKAKQLKQSLALGVNSVCRAIEQNNLSCCLLDGGAKPKLLLTNVLQLTKCRAVPILLLNDLKETVTESLGFSSLAIGFSKTIINDENHEFHQLCSLIINLSKQFIVESEQKVEKDEMVMECEEEPNTETTDKQGETNSVDFSSIYLLRDSTNYRVFHPPDKDEEEEEEMADRNTTNADLRFQHSQCPVPNKKARYFVEPNIVRVQSNPNKLRKKKKKNK